MNSDPSNICIILRPFPFLALVSFAFSRLGWRFLPNLILPAISDVETKVCGITILPVKIYGMNGVKMFHGSSSKWVRVVPFSLFKESHEFRYDSVRPIVTVTSSDLEYGYLFYKGGI